MPFQSLKSFWERTVHPHSGNKEGPDKWHKELQVLYELGIGMEETLRFLYQNKPDFEQFTAWLNSRRQDLVETDTTNLQDVLTPQDLKFWDQNGYIILKNAIPETDCIHTQNAIWEFLKMNPENAETWYKPHEELRGLMLGFSNHPLLHKNRQSARIKKAYEQLYKSKNIYKRIDKVSFNPPVNTHFRFAGDGLHWDVSLKQPIPFALQGLLYLTNCSAEAGAFHCVPGFHHKIENWLHELPARTNPRGIAPQTLKPLAIPGNAGDFVIWHQALPHCATPNRGKSPRMVQYLTYLPLGYEEQKEWI